MDFKKKTGAAESNKSVAKGDVQQVSDQDVNPRTTKADNAIKDAGVETPWQNSHQISKKNGPHWQTHHANSAGLPGQTTWQSRASERGETDGPKQRVNPYGQTVKSDENSVKEKNQTY